MWHLRGHGQPTCTHSHALSRRRRTTGPGNTTAGVGGSRPRETNPQSPDKAGPQEIRGGNGKWSSGVQGFCAGVKKFWNQVVMATHHEERTSLKHTLLMYKTARESHHRAAQSGWWVTGGCGRTNCLGAGQGLPSSLPGPHVTFMIRRRKETWSLSPANTHASTAGPDVWAAGGIRPRSPLCPGWKSTQQILRQPAGIWAHGTPTPCPATWGHGSWRGDTHVCRAHSREPAWEASANGHSHLLSGHFVNFCSLVEAEGSAVHKWVFIPSQPQPGPGGTQADLRPSRSRIRPGHPVAPAPGHGAACTQESPAHHLLAERTCTSWHL